MPPDGDGESNELPGENHISEPAWGGLEQALLEDWSARCFTLEYQPQINLNSKQIVRFEALLRWRHHAMGDVPPMTFVPLAEKIGIIGDIGQWVLERACVDAMQWPREIGVAVNVSATRMHDGALPSIVRNALLASGLPAARLELEITETAEIAFDPDSFKVLDALRALGVRITIDDLDVGHASFRYLLDFPFDKIKVDYSYTALLGQSGRRGETALAIMQTIAGLSHRLKITCLAEGVETVEQLRIVMGANYTEAQGFLFSHPVTPDKVVSLLAEIADIWNEFELPPQFPVSVDLSFFQVADVANDIIIVTTPDLAMPGPTIIYVNPAFTRLTGYSYDEAIGQSPRMLQGPGTSKANLNAIKTTLSEGRAAREQVLNFAKCGAPYWLDMRIEPLRDATGTITHFVAIERDVTLNKRRLDELEHMADRDVLTGIPNRRAFLRIIEVEAASSAGIGDAVDGPSLCLAWIDIDNFKNINDAHGHAAGDAILFDTADRLAQNMRRVDTIGRLGGEEFAACLPAITLEDAHSLADRLCHAISASLMQTDTGRVRATVSIGVAKLAPGEDVASLMARADAAMYKAKHGGGDRVCSSSG